MGEIEGTMHIVCAADADYGANAGITLSSVLDANVGEQIHFHLLSDGVSPADITKMARMARGAGAQFSTHDTKQRLENLLKIPRYTAAYYSRTIYARLFLSELFE
jgi:lipopolysaccharide biosynthesis glycosyltransferase